MRDTYSDAITISRGLQDLDGPNVNPMCHTRVYTHGRRVENALVLLHGFTNCPQQFDALGRRFFERGWNVVIPRYPRHGYTDRLNDSISERWAGSSPGCSRRHATTSSARSRSRRCSG